MIAYGPLIWFPFCRLLGLLDLRKISRACQLCCIVDKRQYLNDSAYMTVCVSSTPVKSLNQNAELLSIFDGVGKFLALSDVGLGSHWNSRHFRVPLNAS